MNKLTKDRATQKLLRELTKGDDSATDKGYIDISVVEDAIGVSTSKYNFSPNQKADSRKE